MLQFASIASGSNGNCYFVGDGTDAVLVDAGISCRETERRMSRLGLSPAQVKAIFISHEHSDHISGLSVLARKYQLPVYINSSTLYSSRLEIPSHLIREMETSLPVKIGNIQVQPFAKSHDAADPVSFVVSRSGYNVGVFTDIGYACHEINYYLNYCHAVFLESNYCDEMLAGSRYPLALKRRISGKKGHLSNKEAFELLFDYRPRQLSHVILSHLSANNNHPDRVQSLFSPLLGRYTIHIASRQQESPLFRLSPDATPVPLASREAKQMSLPF